MNLIHSSTGPLLPRYDSLPSITIFPSCLSKVISNGNVSFLLRCNSHLERDKPDLRLDAEAARDNLESLYGEDEHEIKVRQKLDDLVQVNVVDKDEEGFYMSEKEVFSTLPRRATA